MSNRRLTPGFQLISYARDGTGSLDRAWFGKANIYVKPNQVDQPFVVANELLCSRLASAVGLPVPVGDVASDFGGEIVWVSALVTLDGQETAPPAAGEVQVAQPDLVAGMCVFDVWVSNEDRHDENLIYHPKIGLWLIDHDQSLGGKKTGEPEVLERYRDQPLRYHLFRGVDLHPKHVDDWISRIRHVPTSAITRIVRLGASLELYPPDACQGIMEFLEHRRRRLPDLVRQSLGLKDTAPHGAEDAPNGEETT
ncbi:hypothetical protein [Amycolatopsis sp. NPDC001319]|uniref:hypothetical protein n=1 Tax=unclassified Amycolatopsis TaxID=2618356 RepID=UPI0036B5DD2D